MGIEILNLRHAGADSDYIGLRLIFFPNCASEAFEFQNLHVVHLALLYLRVGASIILRFDPIWFSLFSVAFALHLEISLLLDVCWVI